MITKLTIVCLCMTASTMVGLWNTKRKKSKVLYFDSCVKLTEKLIADISFRHENLFAILNEYAQTDKTELGRQIAKFGAAPYDRFEPDGKLLKAEEKRLVSDFFTSLGSSDAETQLYELENYNKRFYERYSEENEKFKRTGNVGLKLSVLLGLAIGILIL